MKMSQYEYRLTKKSLRQFQKLDLPTRKRIFNKLDYFCHRPDPFVFAEKLSDNKAGQYRFRMGDYRVIFDVENNVIKILKIGHRRDIYK